MSIWTITQLTFREAARRKILLAALVLGALFLTVYALGFHLIMRNLEETFGYSNILELNQVRNFFLIAGLYVVNFLTSIMTVLTSVDTLSGEIHSGTIHTLVAKPLRRWEVILGKWLGFVGMITLYLLLMGGGVLLVVALRSGYIPPHPLRALSLMWLNCLILLSVSLAGGVNLSTLANGVLVFGLYGVAFLGGWIEQIGSMLPDAAASRAAVNIGIITSLLLPSEALWKRAAHEVESPLAAALGFTPFSARTYPSMAMIVYAGIYLLLVLWNAVRWFNRRDL